MATKTKLFDTSTLQGLRSAERFKARLDNDGFSVTTKPVGLTRVQITGRLVETKADRDFRRAFTPNRHGEYL